MVTLQQSPVQQYRHLPQHQSPHIAHQLPNLEQHQFHRHPLLHQNLAFHHHLKQARSRCHQSTMLQCIQHQQNYNHILHKWLNLLWDPSPMAYPLDLQHLRLNHRFLYQLPRSTYQQHLLGVQHEQALTTLPVTSRTHTPQT